MNSTFFGMITPWRGRLRYQPGEFLPAGHTTAVERAGQLGLVAGAVSIAPAGFTSDSNHAGTRCQGSHCNRALRAPVRHTSATPKQVAYDPRAYPRDTERLNHSSNRVGPRRGFAPGAIPRLPITAP